VRDIGGVAMELPHVDAPPHVVDDEHADRGAGLLFGLRRVEITERVSAVICPVMTERSEPTSTETATIRARPTMSAAAVALVRFGLRMALPRASTPVRPGRTRSGQPMANASGPAASGPRTVAPRKHNTARAAAG
jgi:hypothetical protein